MAGSDNSADRFERHYHQTCLPRLDSEHQGFIRGLAGKYRLTFQELRQVSEAALDLRMWEENSLKAWWEREEAQVHSHGRIAKKEMLHRLQARLGALRAAPKTYPEQGLRQPDPPRPELVLEQSDRTILGMCPVASDATVCCNLRTLDAVANCGFGCSYCTIQTFYGDRVSFDADLGRKLSAIELESDRFYHIGTGQSSDALMWGNQHGLLDDLCEFAGRNPNVLLEFKTKSRNVAYFLRDRVPPNIVLSWSLNTPVVIRNEEHFTATLEQRLAAARQVADRGIRVGFHFHPMVYYQGWRSGYQAIAESLRRDFDPDEVLFVSYGSVTLIKPVIRAIRQRGRSSKILQMELVPDPKGKLTYPDAVKQEMFDHMHRAMAPWHGEVFFYLCMETARLWESTFGHVYQSNEGFEADFGRHFRAKARTGLDYTPNRQGIES